MIKGSVHQEDITILNIDAPNIGVSKYIKQILTDLKEKTDNSAMVGNFNTPLAT